MKCLYLEAILNGRIDLLTNKELSIIIYSQVQLNWEQLTCVIGQIKFLVRPYTYTVTLLYISDWKIKSNHLNALKFSLKECKFSKFSKFSGVYALDSPVLAYYAP